MFQSATRSGQVAGVVAMAARADGTVLYQGAHGVRRMGDTQPVTDDTVFWLASMTKAITCVGMLQLIEQGKAAMDQPAAELLPALANPQLLTGFDADGQPQLRPAKRPITVRHLLTHTCGMNIFMWDPAMARYMETTGVSREIDPDAPKLNLPLIHESGERWQYSSGIDWAGKVMEAITGQKLGVYLKQAIFDPLGMESTGFACTESMYARRAYLHLRQPDGSLAPQELGPNIPPRIERGGGGLHSTAGDYMTFMLELLNGGGRLLKPETMPLVTENQMGDLRVTPMVSVRPDLSHDAEFFPGVPKAWSAAFMMNLEDAPTGRSAGSLAWAGLTNCYQWIDPKKGVAGLVLAQHHPFADPVVLDLLYGLERGVYEMIG
ncbi:MAG: beta-lactamase family protein [Alphaproteobacteria bacterium]|nr:beta-lactamase family protein [Alphaproteobacteria bacterium]MCB9930869.1 beta-lactamase family protein [Alphaproteobacteria bacterium]